MIRKSIFLLMLFLMILCLSGIVNASQQSELLVYMKKELDRSVNALANVNEVPMYYLSYNVVDEGVQTISASYGAITGVDKTHNRTFAIDCRVGDYNFDNTHEIRGESDFSRFMGGASKVLPLENNEAAIRNALWIATDEAYKSATERYTKVKTNEQVLVEKEDTSADFTIESAHQFEDNTANVIIDKKMWEKRLRELSAIFKEYPFVQTSRVRLLITNDNRYFVDSDGAMIQRGQSYIRLMISCSGTATDGMKLHRTEIFDNDNPAGIPNDNDVKQSIEKMIKELKELMNAPLVEPYTGPAILVNRAAGVFFHEIFGHRIEGHRQKSEMEGQTFAKKVGERILPEFISIYDDPTLSEFNGVFLRGHYLYDDQGVKTTRVPIVEKGILKNFLMSRSPLEGFSHSNGHGRAQAGRSVVSRQGNLIIKSEKEYPFNTLVEMMLEECRRQDKPYGLIFYDISGGFTQTGRYGPQSFKVLPLLVYRHYTDGRPAEVVRGADLVGTPLSSFAKIIATGDDYNTFNGTCGAESGWVPVSATSPSLLVSEVEIEKKFKEQEKPPILEPPYKPKKSDGTF